MRGKVFISTPIKLAFIGMQSALFCDVCFYNGLYVFLGDNGHVKRAQVASTLHKRDDRTIVLEVAFLGVGTATAILGNVQLFRFAEVGFIGFDDLALATKRTH